MTSIRDALRRIELQEQTIARSLLARAVDVNRECKQLAEVSADFARRTTDARPLHAPLDPKVVWKQFASAKYDLAGLDPRQIKTLCISPETAIARELADSLHREPEALQSTSCLMGIIFSYFAKWGDVRSQEGLEELIKKALRVYRRRNPLLLEYRRRASILFQSGADCALAEKALSANEAPKELLHRLRIGLATNLTRAVLSAAVRDYLTNLPARRTEEQGLQSLHYAVTSLLVTELPSKDFYWAASTLLLFDWVERFGLCQSGLRRFIVAHSLLGDPRLKVANWANMSAEARAKFLRWIAKESIVFFFNHVLPDDSANERRKDFWLDYIGAISDFQIALSELHYTQLLAASKLSEVPGFGRVNHPTTSAFLLRFAVKGGKDLVVVEFSENGNAAHAFYASQFESTAGKFRNSKFDFGKLKHEANESRIVHRGAWEYYGRNKLAGWGVRM